MGLLPWDARSICAWTARRSSAATERDSLAVREGLIRSGNPARDVDLPHRPTAEESEEEEVGLELNLDKTRIVYCKDANRKGSHEHERFTFLGYTFRPRLARSRSGEFFVSFCPAVADDAVKEIGRTIKRWRLHLWSGQTLADLARAINPTVRGWINFYGRFYRSRLILLGTAV